MIDKTTTLGKTIKLFLVEGKSTGLISAKIEQWTGQALVCPRSQLPKLTVTDYPEINQPGVYILTGNDTDSKPFAYIGQSENISNRIKNHHQPKKDNQTLDLWDKMYLFTASDNALTTGHIRYLEARLIKIAKAANRMQTENKRIPTNIPLPKPEMDSMEYFIQHMQLLLPALGIILFRPQADEATKESTLDSPLFELNVRGANATAKLVDNEFVILKDSLVRKDEVNSIGNGIKKRRNELLNRGDLIEQMESKNHYRFTKNIGFSSPSAAAAVVVGGEANGRKEWHVKGTKQSYGDWENEQITKVVNTDNTETT